MKNIKWLFLFTILLIPFAVHAEENAVVMNDIEYQTLSEAAKKRTIGENTIKLLQDTTSSSIAITGNKNTTIDLNGHKLTTTGFTIEGATLKIIGNGTLNLKHSKAGDTNFLIYGTFNNTIENYTGIEIGKNVILKTDETEFPISIESRSKIFEISPKTNSGIIQYDRDYGIKIDIQCKMVIPDYTTVFYISRYFKNTEGTIPEIHLGEHSEINSESYAIYAGGYAKWILEGTINAKYQAIEIRSGELNITKGNYHTTINETVVDTSDDGTTNGATIVITQNKDNLPIIVNISNGIFTGATPFVESTQSETTNENINIQITGGTFTSIGNTTITSEDETGFISGGTYTHNIEQTYLASGYGSYHQKDGNYIVRKQITPIINNEKILVKVNKKKKLEVKYQDVDGIIDSSNLDIGIQENEDFIYQNGEFTGVKTGITNAVLDIAGNYSIPVIVYDVKANDEITVNYEEQIAEQIENAITDGSAKGIDEVTAKNLQENIDGLVLTQLEVAKKEEQELNKEDINHIKKIQENYEIGSFYDIKLSMKKSNGEELGNITELNQKIKITIPKEDIIEQNEKEIVIFTVHNGNAKKISNITKNEDGSISFETNEFSPYLVAYRDPQTENQEINSITNTNGTSTNNPKTGDSIIKMILLCMISIIGLTTLFLRKKKNA